MKTKTKLRKTKTVTINKDVFLLEVERLVQERVACDKSRTMSCLWYALCTVVVLRSQGVNAILQAGSASWQIIPDHLDDGVSPTHYSYVYEGCNEMDVLLLFTTGKLPEMHVWAAIPATNEVIDLTTKYIPELARIAGLECKMELPTYVWEDVGELANKGMYYQPTEEATRLAMHLIQ